MTLGIFIRRSTSNQEAPYVSWVAVYTIRSLIPRISSLRAPTGLDHVFTWPSASMTGFQTPRGLYPYTRNFRKIDFRLRHFLFLFLLFFLFPHLGWACVTGHAMLYFFSLPDSPTTCVVVTTSTKTANFLRFVLSLHGTVSPPGFVVCSGDFSQNHSASKLPRQNTLKGDDEREVDQKLYCCGRTALVERFSTQVGWGGSEW